MEVKDGVKIKGMFHLQIVEDMPDGSQKIVGDSGWIENLVTNGGFLNVTKLIGTGNTGSQISHAALGTGGAPSAADTTQSGEVSTNGSGSVVRAALTAVTSSSSKTLRNTGSFASNSVVTATANISNIGLWNTSGPTTASGALMCGNTYTSSALATNQSVQFTYDLIFA